MLSLAKTWIKEKYSKHAVILGKKLPVIVPRVIFPKLTDLTDADYDKLSSVACFIGPYRNLTTAISLMLFMHPNIQVLNHADKLVIDYPEYNFLNKPNPKKMRTFIGFGLSHYHSHQDQFWGRHITKSHAVRDPARVLQRNLLLRRYGLIIRKDDIQSLIWKGALTATNYLKDHSIKFDQLFDIYPRLKFILPVRNPIDCALSNFKLRDSSNVGMKTGSVKETLELIVSMLAWGLLLEEQYPERVFSLFQYELNKNKLITLSEFLGVDPSTQWIEDVLRVYDFGQSKLHDGELAEHYQDIVSSNPSISTDNKNKLLRFLTAPN